MMDIHIHRRQDAKERRDAIEQRRKDMKISQKQAILATQNQKLQNRLMANRMKLEAEVI